MREHIIKSTYQTPAIFSLDHRKQIISQIKEFRMKLNRSDLISEDQKRLINEASEDLVKNPMYHVPGGTIRVELMRSEFFEKKGA